MFDKKKTTLGQKRRAKKSTATSSNAFLSGGMKKSAVTKSGNGARKFKSTGNDWVDQFGKTTEYKAPRSFKAIAKDCDVLFAQDPELFIKFTLFLRMISRKTDIVGMGIKTQEAQSGAELKHEGIMRMIWLHMQDPDLFWENIGLFVSAGSCKDVITMLTYDLVYNGWDGRVLDWKKFGDLILSLLNDEKTVNLMKKYLPQIRAKSQLTTVEAEAKVMIAKWICSLLYGNKEAGSTYKMYRKLKTSGTAHEWQQLISQRKFDQLDFTAIHGRALNLLVRSKFLRNQNLQDRYVGWVDKQETVKYTGFVHELLCELDKKRDSAFEKTVDKQFEELVQKVKGNDEMPSKLIVVRDVSSSMNSIATGTKFSCYNVAKALALYFSAFLDGPFEDHYINFESKAEMHQWKGTSVSRKWRNAKEGWFGSTNFQSVIDLFCSLKRSGIDETDFPEGIVCISDMEFNPTRDLKSTNVESALAKLKRAGFSDDYVANFKIVLWNLQNNYYGSRSGTKFETYGNTNNVFYMSGYSGSNVKFLLGQKIDTAEDLFNAAMDQELLNLVKV